MKKFTILKRGVSSILLIFFLVIFTQEFNLKSLNSINKTKLTITPQYTDYLKENLFG